ncbi:MAG: hypothetical protein AAB289_15825, partial [Chloroflexota bacterium]
NGTIVLDGGDRGVVSVSGTLEARGADSSTTGGTVKVLGQYVGLMGGANINASGDAGGGTALVGGNYQGTGSEFRATATYMDRDATISADAITLGAGGKVIVWSDGFTSAHGTIWARGGARGGNGGLIETSGHHILDATGVRGGAGAPNGRGGLWLFDPDTDVTITTGATTNNTGSVGGLFTPINDVATSNILNTDINSVLDGGTSVVITTANAAAVTNGTAGNITVSAPITHGALGGARTLTLNAGAGGGAGSIFINDAITATNTANSLSVVLSSPLGNISFGAGTGSITTFNGNVTANAPTGTVTLGAINTGTGTLGVTAGGAVTQNGSLTIGGTTLVTAGANAITLTTGTNNFTGAVTLSNTGANNASITDANALTLGTLTLGGDLTATSTGALNLGAGTVAGNLVASTNAAGAVTQTGSLTVTGTSNINAGLASDIALNSLGNDFQGAVSLTGANTGIVDANALTLGTLAVTNVDATSTGALNLGTGTVLGNIGAISNGGAVTQSGPLTVGNVTNINAGAGNITLTQATNDFQGRVSVAAGGALQITDANAINLDASVTSMTVIASGAVTQTAANIVTGTTSVNAGTGAITWTNAGNNFIGAVTLTGGTTQITDQNALTLGTLATGALTANSTGALDLGSGTVTGNLVANSNANPI